MTDRTEIEVAAQAICHRWTGCGLRGKSCGERPCYIRDEVASAITTLSAHRTASLPDDKRQTASRTRQLRRG